MIADVRQRTNLETSTFVTDAEITEYLNQELAELWAHIAQGSGAPHYRAAFPIAVTTNANLYPLPDDFWQAQEVSATVDGVTYRVRSFGPGERAWLTNSQARFPWLSTTRYRIQADNIEFQPVTQAFSAVLYYTPSQPRLVNGGDTFDGYNGYEMAAIYGACATVQAKEDTDPNFHIGQRERIYRLIDSLAAQRDANEPERVQDVTIGTGDVSYGDGWIP
jgi:hypothetical protein